MYIYINFIIFCLQELESSTRWSTRQRIYQAPKKRSVHGILQQDPLLLLFLSTCNQITLTKQLCSTCWEYIAKGHMDMTKKLRRTVVALRFETGSWMFLSLFWKRLLCIRCLNRTFWYTEMQTCVWLEKQNIEKGRAVCSLEKQNITSISWRELQINIMRRNSWRWEMDFQSKTNVGEEGSGLWIPCGSGAADFFKKMASPTWSDDGTRVYAPRRIER